MLNMSLSVKFASIAMIGMITVSPVVAADARIPIHLESLTEATNRLDASEVVILGILNAYTDRPRSPSSVLNTRLADIRGLEDAVGRVTIFVVEGGTVNNSAAPRAIAQSLYQQWDLVEAYDMTLPVIFIFHEGLLIDVTTFRSKQLPPWEHAPKLAEIVQSRLDAKFILNAIREDSGGRDLQE